MLVQAIGNPVPFLKKPRFRSSCCEEPCWTCAGMNYYSWHMESLWRHFGPLCWHKELCNVMMLQAAPSTCRCSLEEGPHVRFWVSCQNVGDVFSRFDLPSVCDFIVGWCWTLFYATASGSYRSFHSSKKFLRQVQVQMLDQRVEDPSECCKDTSINVNIVFASVPCPFSRLRSFVSASEDQNGSRQLNVRPQSSLLSLPIKRRSSRMQRFFMNAAQQVQRI